MPSHASCQCQWHWLEAGCWCVKLSWLEKGWGNPRRNVRRTFCSLRGWFVHFDLHESAGFDKFSKDAKVKLTLFQKNRAKNVSASSPSSVLKKKKNWRWRRRRNVFCPIFFWNKVNFTFASFENLSAIMHVKSKRSFNLLKSAGFLSLPGQHSDLSNFMCILCCYFNSFFGKIFSWGET